MKVLWFTLTPGLSEGYLKEIPMGGGWIKSLEKVMQTKVALNVAFYSDKQIAPFKLGDSNYFPIKKYKHGNLSKIKKKIFNELEPDNDIKNYLNIINKVKPDLIHVHGTEGAFGLIQKYTHIPTVISIQGNITVYMHKYFSGISYADIIKHSNFKSWFFMRTFALKYSYFKKQALREKEILSYSKYILGRTHWDKRIMSILAPNATYFHNDEILRDKFYMHSWQYKEKESIDLFTTNGPNIYKGIETLIYCAHLLEINNIKFTWKIAGLNANDEVVKIASKSIKIKISTNIYFLGNLSEETLIKQMLDSSIYVAISHIENSPNSLCEAQLIGMPCIATNAGGTQSLVTDNESALLIQDGDPYVMAGAIKELSQNKNKLISFGSIAREKALLRHDIEKNQEELMNIYTTVLNNQK